MMAAVAIDQDAAQPHLARLAKRDLHGPAVGMRRCMASSRTRHAAIKAASQAPRKLSIRCPALGALDCLFRKRHSRRGIRTPKWSKIPSLALVS